MRSSTTLSQARQSRGTGVVVRGLDKFGHRWWWARRAKQSADCAGAAAGGQFVAGRMGRGVLMGALARQGGQASLDVAPDAAQSDAEHALAATQQVDHLVVG